MWRRVINLASSTFGKKNAVEIPKVVAVSSPSHSPATSIFNHSNNSMEAQHAILREAVKELSHGLAKPLQLSPMSSLLQWDAQFRSNNESQLTIEQLEELGRAYYEGHADPNIGEIDPTGSSTILAKDEVMAVAVWQAAALRGSVEASYSYAVCIREGRGCTKDPKEAYSRMLALAEKSNYHLAHYALGIMITNSEGQEGSSAPDHLKAFHHFSAAAKGGVLPALHNIANAYASGRGVKQSDYNAMLYYQAAADAGDPHAKFSLAGWLHIGRGTPQGQKFPEKAFAYNLEAAQAGHPAAMFNVGAAFMSGAATGEGKNYMKAAGWFEKASYEGTGRIVEASINLGNMYHQGLGVTRDRARAKAIFLRCAGFNEVCAKLVAEIDAEEKAQL